MKSTNYPQFQRIAHHLKELSGNQRKNSPVTFGVIYTAPYANKVHEDLEIVHPNGQAKFLEQPLRENQQKLLQMVKDQLKQKKTLKEALTLAANWLLEESKKLVPVQTGTLRDSGIIKIV